MAGRIPVVFIFQCFGNPLLDLRQSEILEGARSRGLRERLAVLDLLESGLDGLVKLLILTGIFLDRVIVQQDVRIDTVVLDDPLARRRVVVREERHAHVGSVHVRQGAADAHDSTPSPRSDHRSKVVGLEAPREEVTVRC